MIILTYHTVHNITSFEAQINYLVSHRYNVLSLAEFIERNANKTLQSKDVLITFDDGDYTVLENALPVLVKYNCAAVLFVITSLINTQQPFWWDEILYYTNDKNQVLKAKTISNSERLDMLTQLRLQQAMPALKYRQLTWGELKTLEKHGIDIGNHSHTHPMMDKLSENEIEDELATSSDCLKRMAFPFHDIFAYPNGNHTESTEKILIQTRMRASFLFDHQLYKPYGNRFRISRLSVNDNTPLWKFKIILNGLHSRIVPVTKKFHKLIS